MSERKQVTETIDRLYLELSQFTSAKTKRELDLEARIAELEAQNAERVIPKEQLQIGEWYLCWTNAGVPVAAKLLADSKDCPWMSDTARYGDHTVNSPEDKPYAS